MAITWKVGRDYEMDYSVSPPVKVPRLTYDGAVLGTFSRDERIMSDVWDYVSYARVWDGEKVIKVSLGVMDMGGLYGTATVDATDEVKALALAEAERLVAESRERETADRLARIRAAASVVARGKEVRVVRGRKVAKGTEGRVFWVGSTDFGTRVGLELVDGSRVFTALSNVEVVL